MHNPSIPITSGNVAQTGTNRNSYDRSAQRGAWGENNTGSSLAVHARTAGRNVSHLGMFMSPSRNVSNNCVITILIHEKRLNKNNITHY
jgi:hypothetical protein